MKLSYLWNYIKRGRKYQKYLLRIIRNNPNGFGIHKCIKGGRKSKQKMFYHLFNDILRGRKYQEYILSQVRNYLNRYLELTSILRDVGNLKETDLTFAS